MYFICCLADCGPIPQPFKILLYNREGWLCVCGVLYSFPFVWSVVVYLPNGGVYLPLKNPIYKVYFICYVVLGLASVPCRSFRGFWVLLLLDLGTEDGPSVCIKLRSTLTTVAFLQSNLNLGVHGSDEF